MEMPASLEQKWNQLNDTNRRQANCFIDFLLEQQRRNGPTQGGRSRIVPGIWKSEPFYIAEDFDEPLEDFKEYM